MEIKRLLNRLCFIKILASSVFRLLILSLLHSPPNGRLQWTPQRNPKRTPSAILPVLILIIFSVFKAYSTFLSSNKGMIKRNQQTKNKRPPSQETYHQNDKIKENKKTPTMIILTIVRVYSLLCSV